MAGERIDYSIERKRHESFAGREELLARLDRLLVTEPGDRWVLVTGGPGMGKSALLAWWLARRERAGDRIPHHFIRRGEYDWDDPGKLVGSLVWQIEQRFPAQREPDEDARLHPAARLAAILMRVSAHELAPSGGRLVVLIDGLDEYDPPPGARPADPLAAFLPHALPPGVSFLCASRPRHPYVSQIEARSGELVRIDLDAPEQAASNDATVRAFWVEACRPLGLGAVFINEAVGRAGGNLQHATMLRKYLAGLPPAQRKVKSVPSGLEALLEKLWDRVSAEPLAVQGLGILCAAREALTLEELGAVAGWTDEARSRAFLWSARELLVETWRPDGRREFRLHHESIREYIAKVLGDAALHRHRAALAQRLAVRPGAAQPAARRAAPRRILHLSDLHCTTDNQATVWYSQLAADLRDQGVEHLDALVVSGDLTERAEPAEYAAARRFLEQLMAGFGLAPRQVALVPGNHDASWPLAEQAYQLHRRKQYTGALVPGRYIERDGGIVEVRDEAAYRERLRPFADLYRAIKGAEYPLPFEEQGIVDELADLGLCILGLNSAWETDPNFRDRASIHPEALASALLRLGPPPADQLRIAVFHHPIHGGEDARLRDAAFLQQLAVHGFRLALHGHVHKADAELYRYDRTADGRRIDIIAAGTFGASTREWVPGYPLQYNLLLVGPDRITVETRCRREVNGAWEPDARWRQGPGKDPLPRYSIDR
jgi:predicted MPP superfamily phosphohydrolase